MVATCKLISWTPNMDFIAWAIEQLNSFRSFLHVNWAYMVLYGSYAVVGQYHWQTIKSLSAR